MPHESIPEDLSASDFVFPLTAAEQVPHASAPGVSKAAGGMAVLPFGMAR
jgi:hypothetical protein